MNEGWICLHRRLKKWRWYHDINTRITFIHCLLSANYEDGYFQNEVIKRGSFVTSLTKLSKEIGITVQSLRTSLEHLKLTNELTIKTTNKFTVITVINYNSYQDYNKEDNNQLTNNQQSTNNNITNKQYNNITSIYNYIEQNFGRLISSTEYEKVENWVKEFNLDMVGYAFEISVAKEVKRFDFVQGILNNWKSAGFKSLEQIKESEQKFRDKKFTKDGYEIGKVYEVDGIKFKFDEKGEKHIL